MSSTVIRGVTEQPVSPPSLRLSTPNSTDRQPGILHKSKTRAAQIDLCCPLVAGAHTQAKCFQEPILKLFINVHSAETFQSCRNKSTDQS